MSGPGLETASRRPFARDNKGERAVPFSIRLTASEKRRLREKAGDTPLGLYLRDLALDGVPLQK